MKILNLSLDSSILDKNSVSAKRMIEYGSVVDKYIVVVPSMEKREIEISPNVRAIGSGGKNKLSQLFGIYRCAKAIIEKEKIDCVSTQDPFEVGLIGLLLVRKFRFTKTFNVPRDVERHGGHAIGLNIQEHGDFFSQKYWRNERLLHLIRYYVGLYVIKRADSIRAVSLRIKNHLVSQLQIAPEKIITVPVFTECKEPTAKTPGKEKDNFIFLNMGRFVRQKNLALLLNAFSKVVKKHPQARLILIGRGPEEKKLKSICTQLNITDVVNFLDWTDEIDEYYAKADVYVLSSDYEGWGRVIIEAAYHNLPIVMTDVGCAGEAVVNGESALISPVNDTEAFTCNMFLIMEDSALRARLSANALRDIKKLPNKKESLDLYLKSWEQAVR